MKTPRLHYFKQNTAELPEGYRKPIKRRRKPALAPDVPERIIIPVKMKAESLKQGRPVIRRRTPRGRLMPLRMKNEWIPRNADWCQINGQKVRQDIFFGEVVGRVFIPGLFTGEACGSCGPSMLDFGGGCGDSGCEGCGSSDGGGGESAACESAGCASEGCGTGGAACEGCAGCEGEGCASAGCASSGCDTGGGPTGGGCESSGCAVDGCAGCASCADSGCDTGGPTSGGGCDTGCTGCAGEGCGGCEAAGCASTGCADSGCDTGCGMGCDAGCAAACAETGCGMGCVGPSSDFGSWGPTAAVDATGGGPGWGVGPASTGWGQGGAMGPPGWATGDFGSYGIGGPTGTGFGPGAPSASIGGPQAYAQAPGITGFPGDFGGPPGGPLGMPQSQGDVGPQAGPGMPGGPGYVGTAEPAFTPTGPETTTPTVDPNSRTDVDPAQNFGPAQTASTGWFGPSQAQAADRGSDTLATMLQAAPTTSQVGLEGTFATVQAAANALAQSNPALAEALSQAAANMQAPGLAAPGQLGPGMTGFEGATPGAQQGFTGVSNAQNSPSAFTSFAGQQPQAQVEGAGPPSQGDRAAGNDMLTAAMLAAQENQQLATDMFDAQSRGEQARGPQQDDFSSRFDAVTTPQQTINNAFDLLAPADTFDSRFGDPSQFAPAQMTPQQSINDAFDQLSQANQQQAMQQALPFDAQSRGEQGRGPDSFDSRFGDPNQFAPTQDVTPPATRGADEVETISLSRGQDVISNLEPATKGVGGGIGVPGLLSMVEGMGRPGGSPPGLPSQPGGRPGGSPFGPPGSGPFGRPGDTGGRPGLSITVGGRPSSSNQGGRPGGYYDTGGRGIAPGARGAEYGGIYGPGVATGRPGTNTFGVSSREGAYGYYDPATGLYYR